MHELGIVVQVVRIAQEAANQNHLTKVNKIVIQIGELCGAIPEFAKKLFPVAIHDNEMFEGCELDIEEVPGIAACEHCGNEYKIVEARGRCPKCRSQKYKMISGTQFMIKEIMAS